MFTNNFFVAPSPTHLCAQFILDLTLTSGSASPGTVSPWATRMYLTCSSWRWPFTDHSVTKRTTSWWRCISSPDGQLNLKCISFPEKETVCAFFHCSCSQISTEDCSFVLLSLQTFFPKNIENKCHVDSFDAYKHLQQAKNEDWSLQWVKVENNVVVHNFKPEMLIAWSKRLIAVTASLSMSTLGLWANQLILYAKTHPMNLYTLLISSEKHTDKY